MEGPNQHDNEDRSNSPPAGNEQNSSTIDNSTNVERSNLSRDEALRLFLRIDNFKFNTPQNQATFKSINKDTFLPSQPIRSYCVDWFHAICHLHWWLSLPPATQKEKKKAMASRNRKFARFAVYLNSEECRNDAIASVEGGSEIATEIANSRVAVVVEEQDNNNGRDEEEGRVEVEEEIGTENDLPQQQEIQMPEKTNETYLKMLLVGSSKEFTFHLVLICVHPSQGQETNGLQPLEA